MVIDNEAGRDPEVIVGAPVFTSDGDEIGKVKEVKRHYFKVDQRLHPDFWLQRQFVESAAQDKVVVQIAKKDLDEYKVKDFNDDDDDEPIRDVEEDRPDGQPENIASATIDAAEEKADEKL